MKVPIRVLVVDDSAFARKVVREVLEVEPDIEVVGIARDGLDALDRIAELSPDVVTLDLSMPHLDGLGVLAALSAKPGPRVVVVSSESEQSERGLAALRAGAIDVVRKPTAVAEGRLYGLAGDLVAKVRAAAGARPRSWPEPPDRAPAPEPRLAAPRAAVSRRLVAVGTSTGGPQALTRLLARMPADLPVPLVIALHIPPGFTAPLAARLDGESPLSVSEAHDGLLLRPGMAVLACAGMHLKIERDGPGLVARLDLQPALTPHHPSVDVLFESAAAACGPGLLAVVMTGMGDDGLAGARAVRASGGAVLTEAESSCVVYGMPRAVREAGLAHDEAPLEELPAAIVRNL